MIHLTATKARLSTRDLELLTAGMANAVLCRFSFSDDWTGLQKVLVFTNGIETRDIILSGDECYIPHEVLITPRVRVRVGVYGTDGENVILPTIWANLGDVHDAPDPSEDETTDPSLPIWAEILANIGSLSDLLTKDKESIVRAINEIVQNGGGGTGGGISSDTISSIQVLDRTEFDALPKKNPAVLYLIRG